jgi:hypothetical protein
MIDTNSRLHCSLEIANGAKSYSPAIAASGTSRTHADWQTLLPRCHLSTLLLPLLAICWFASVGSAQPPTSRTYAALPQSFEPVAGQDKRAEFTSHGVGYTLSVAPNTAHMQLIHAAARPRQTKSASLQFTLVGANPEARAEAMGLQAGKANYLIGNNPDLWQTGIPQYGRIEYRQVYPGIDVAYYGNHQQLEYDFILGPHADPGRIRLAIDGADRIRIDKTGDLVLTVGDAEIRERKPVLYQDTPNGRRPVQGRYVARGKNQVGFEVASYDKNTPLVIDPVVVFSTYFGGTGDDIALSLALDASNNIYISGLTGSPTLHGTYTIGAPSSSGSDTAAFVAKFSPAGALIFSTFIGGSNDQAFASAVSLDSSGNIYLSGNTSSATFPTLDPIQKTYGGGDDVFVLELNPSGNALIYSTYLGGSKLDYATGVAVDASGNTYVTGSTESANFPVVNAVQPKLPGTLNTFAVKIAPGGGSFIYSTYYGGSAVDFSNGMTIDTAGDLILYGDTSSTNFPVLNALQPSFCGWSAGQTVSNNHGWVAMLNPAGVPLYATYICGSVAGDAVRAGLVDSSGNLIISGGTESATFPTLNAFQSVYGGGTEDAFVMRLTSTGALISSTYLGGNGDDVGRGLALDSTGTIYIVGGTASTNFPTMAPLQSANAGSYDGFLTKMNPTASQLIFSTYVGGSLSDEGYSVKVDSQANAYLVGITDSSNFPTSNAFQPKYGGGSDDAFVAVVWTCVFTLPPPGAFPVGGASGVQSVTTTPECGWTATTGTPWITITSSPASGTGSGSVSYTVSPNSGALRTGSLTIGGQSVAITQAGAPLPTLTVTLTNSASFTQGQNGATYTATVSNSAAGSPTSGTVTVTETVPAGLTLVSMAGTGWTCSTNTCTRSDALPAGSSYPQITITVNVASNAPATVVDQVAVSGGGSANASASDSTTVIPSTFTSILTLTNTGSSPLTFTSVTINGIVGKNVTQTNNCPATLAVSGSCTITVTHQ